MSGREGGREGRTEGHHSEALLYWKNDSYQALPCSHACIPECQCPELYSLTIACPELYSLTVKLLMPHLSFNAQLEGKTQREGGKEGGTPNATIAVDFPQVPLVIIIRFTNLIQ